MQLSAFMALYETFLLYCSKVDAFRRIIVVDVISNDASYLGALAKENYIYWV